MDEVRQVVVHPAVWDSLQAWLKARGIVLVNIDSVLGGDDIPTYVMQPISLEAEDQSSYRLVQFLDWAFHRSHLDVRIGDGTGWSRICDKWEDLNAEREEGS